MNMNTCSKALRAGLVITDSTRRVEGEATEQENRAAAVRQGIQKNRESMSNGGRKGNGARDQQSLAPTKFRTRYVKASFYTRTATGNEQLWNSLKIPHTETIRDALPETSKALTTRACLAPSSDMHSAKSNTIS